MRIKKTKLRIVSVVLLTVLLMTTALPLNVSAAESYGIGFKQFPTFTFTHDNMGAWKNVIAGTQMRIYILYKPADSLPNAVALTVDCFQYGGKKMSGFFIPVGTPEIANGYRAFVSPWFNITSGTDYRFYYTVSDAFQWGTYPTRSASVKVGMEIR